MKTFTLALALACVVAIANADGPMCEKLKEMMNEECTGPKDGAMESMQEHIKKKCEEKESPEKCSAMVEKFKADADECLKTAQETTKDMEKSVRCDEFVKTIKTCMDEKRKN